MKKRLIAMTLLFSLIMSTCCFSAVAIESCEIDSPETYSAEMLAIIDAEREELYKNLVSQLEAQDALDKIDHFMFLIDDTINAKYYSNVNSVAETTSSNKAYAPHGGWYYVENSQIRTEARYYSVEATAQFAKRTDLTASAIVSFVASKIKVENIIIKKALTIISVIEAFSFLNSLKNAMIWDDIVVNEDGFMVISTFDKFDETTTTVEWEWVSFPYFSISNSDLVAYGVCTEEEDREFVNELKKR